MTFYKDDHGAWHWIMRGHNGEPVVSSHEPDGFVSLSNAERNAELATAMLGSWMANRDHKVEGNG